MTQPNTHAPPPEERAPLSSADEKAAIAMYQRIACPACHGTGSLNATNAAGDVMPEPPSADATAGDWWPQRYPEIPEGQTCDACGSLRYHATFCEHAPPVIRVGIRHWLDLLDIQARELGALDNADFRRYREELGKAVGSMQSLYDAALTAARTELCERAASSAPTACAECARLREALDRITALIEKYADSPAGALWGIHAIIAQVSAKTGTVSEPTDKCEWGCHHFQNRLCPTHGSAVPKAEAALRALSTQREE